MLSKIIGNIKGSKEDGKNSKLSEKIAKMDLSEMRIYINGKLKEYQVDEFGLMEVAKRLTLENENTSNYYLKLDDMDSKKKKVFDLVILILEHKKMSIDIIEIFQQFLETYEEIIKQYDKDNKQIYDSRIKEYIKNAAHKIDFKADVADKMRTLK